MGSTYVDGFMFSLDRGRYIWGTSKTQLGWMKREVMQCLRRTRGSAEDGDVYAAEPF